MKNWHVDVIFEVYLGLDIKAKTKEEAEKEAEKRFLEFQGPLRYSTEIGTFQYIDDSWDIKVRKN